MAIPQRDEAEPSPLHTDGAALNWFATIRELTMELVRVRGVSPSVDEIVVARRIRELFMADGMEGAYDLCELVPIPGDPWGRQNTMAVVRGVSDTAIVLTGHFDTVGIEDYGALAHLATDPNALAHHLPDLLDGAELPDAANWLFGRGAADMKSGIAIIIALMRYWTARRAAGDPPPLTLVAATCADEETQSAGMLAAMAWLADLRQQLGLRYAGLINVDLVSPRYPGDPARMIYTGSVGKLLPLFFIVGAATHAGDPFGGVDANVLCADLVRALALNPALADRAGQEQTAPPVTLHQGDLKTVYNTQTAHEAWMYLNVLTMHRSPGAALKQLQRIAGRTLRATLARLGRRYRQMREREDRIKGTSAHPLPEAEQVLPEHLARGQVLTYAELHGLAVQRCGEAPVRDALAQARAACPATMDLREATLHLVRELWRLSALRGPAIIIAFAPPFYPHIGGSASAFDRAVSRVAARHATEGVQVATYFPLLSDLSYARLEADLPVADLVANMPLWVAESREPQGPRYTIPFGAIRAAAIPGVANIGPYGIGAHQRGERVHMPYSFTTVPQMILEVITEVGSAGGGLPSCAPRAHPLCYSPEQTTSW